MNVFLRCSGVFCRAAAAPCTPARGRSAPRTPRNLVRLLMRRASPHLICGSMPFPHPFSLLNVHCFGVEGHTSVNGNQAGLWGKHSHYWRNAEQHFGWGLGRVKHLPNGGRGGQRPSHPKPLTAVDPHQRKQQGPKGYLHPALPVATALTSARDYKGQRPSHPKPLTAVDAHQRKQQGPKRYLHLRHPSPRH
jgi:hypothetical protein